MQVVTRGLDGDMAHVEGQLGRTALHLASVSVPPDQRLHGDIVSALPAPGQAGAQMGLGVQDQSQQHVILQHQNEFISGSASRST